MHQNRQIPNDIDKNKFINNINEIEKLFTHRWLNTDIHKNILKQLWHRQDFLASIELHLLGCAIKEINTDTNQDWLSDFIQQIKTNKIAQIIGAIQEIIVATLFKNTLNLAKPNQMGYDLELLLSKQLVRLSIKKLQSSDIEKTYNLEFQKLEQHFIKQLKKHRLNGFSLLIYSMKKDSYSFDKIIKIINKAIKLKKEHLRVNTIDDYIIAMNDITCNSENFGLDSNKVSYQLNLIFPHNDSELKRFTKLFSKSASNINKVESTKDEINSISISLPTSVSITEASKWIKREFNRHKYTRISFVILFKFVVVSEKDTSFLNMEQDIIMNVNAKYTYNFTQAQMQMVLPVGRISKGDSNYHIFNGTNESLEIKNSYVYQSGFKSCIHLFGPKQYNINSVFNLIEEITISPNDDSKTVTITPIRPISDKLTIL